jgi:type VI secretion system protein ImpC
MSAEQQAQQQSAAAAETTAYTMDDILAATPNTNEDRAKDLVKELVSEVMAGTVTVGKDILRTIQDGIAGIDQVVSKQLSEIMHHERFQKLEGSWRGLHYLISNSETGEDLKIRVLNATKDTLYKDLDRAVEFDQSNIFKKIYTAEFGTPGGAPYSALIGDYEFSNSPQDIDCLGKMSNVAAAAFAPFITAPSSRMFGFDSWTKLGDPRDLKKIFDTEEYIKWRSFRDTEDARFVVMSMPRVMARLPYGQNTVPVDAFQFEEVALGPNNEPIEVDHDDYCWMNAAYALGSRLTDAFAQTGWCTAIRGVENGGKVEGLPSHVVKTPKGDKVQKCPTEVLIDDRREKEFSDMGFLTLNNFKGTDYAVFFGAQTCQKAKVYNDPDATANAAISARLPYIMAASRFSHYLKVIARDKIGSFMERADCEDWLDRWIHEYVAADANPSAAQRARYPLAEAEVKVEEIAGSPGEYNARVFLRPWLQMEELTARMSMVAKIPKLGGN